MRICVFCGSRLGARPAYARAARALGELLAREKAGLVYGGGGIGLMGVLADSVLEHGGEVVGVIPHSMMAKELGHPRLTEMHVVDTMHERKAKMAELTDAFLALPGGMGTLDEICEALTWSQLGIHARPCALLDVEGYWKPFVAQLDRAAEEGFLERAHREAILVDDDAPRLLERMRAWRPGFEAVWLKREQA